MTEKKEIKKEKKTLSLKLGSKPIFSNKRGIEAGKTVIVEKKRYKRNTSTDQKPDQVSLNKKEVTSSQNVIEKTITEKKSRSGVILKPLTKDEQKKILQADSKEEKNDKKLEEYKVSKDLIDFSFLSKAMLVKLAENNIKTLEDFAGLTTDDLIGYLEDRSDKNSRVTGLFEEFNINKDEGDQLIMEARKIWLD